MSNFAGLVVMAIGVMIIIIGIRGTQGAVFGGILNNLATKPDYTIPNPTAPKNSGLNTVAKNPDGSCPKGYVPNSYGNCSFLMNA